MGAIPSKFNDGQAGKVYRMQWKIVEKELYKDKEGIACIVLLSFVDAIEINTREIHSLFLQRKRLPSMNLNYNLYFINLLP